MNVDSSDGDVNHENIYDLESFSSGSSHAFVVELTPADKTVLELGAGSGIISKSIAETQGCTVTAIDAFPSQMLRKNVSNVLTADINDKNWINVFTANDKFNVIIAADVLEHLYDPWAVLIQMKSLLTDAGAIILSLPHASHSGILAALLNNNFDYSEKGLLDKTHIRFFSLSNIISLHRSAGLKIIDVRFVLKTPEETELSKYWNKLSHNQKKALSENREGLIYQIIVKSTPMTTDDEESIDLFNVPIDLEYPNYLSDFQKYLLRKLSEFLCTTARIIKSVSSSSSMRNFAEVLHNKGVTLFQRSIDP